jgi:hypothetical protein
MHRDLHVPRAGILLPEPAPPPHCADMDVTGLKIHGLSEYQGATAGLVGHTGAPIEADVKSALAELESISEADLKTAVTSIGVAALGGLAAGGTAGAIEAGIAAAPAAFEAAGKDISNKTTSTLVTSIVNSLATPAVAAGTNTATTGQPS